MARVRTRPTREDTIDRLLCGAAEAFAEYGVHGAALEDICSRADLTRGAFYSSFKSKEELALALHARLAEELIEMFRQALEDLPPTKSSHEFVAALVSRLQFDRQAHVLMTEFHLLALRNTDFGTRIALQHRRFFSTMAREAMQAAARSGFRVAVDMQVLPRSLGALFFHGHLQSLLDPGLLKPGELVQAVAPFLFVKIGEKTAPDGQNADDPAPVH